MRLSIPIDTPPHKTREAFDDLLQRVRDVGGDDVEIRHAGGNRIDVDDDVAAKVLGAVAQAATPREPERGPDVNEQTSERDEPAQVSPTKTSKSTAKSTTKRAAKSTKSAPAKAAARKR